MGKIVVENDKMIFWRNTVSDANLTKQTLKFSDFPNAGSAKSLQKPTSRTPHALIMQKLRGKPF
ncbi:MAG: hypothetical protein L6V93_14500 [Clostridiales bacterium]|nr:MAG: hypothetical protein L6V93_14500 [Clostridiales bacterium]